MTWWWLSFADGHRPRGKQFLGVVMVSGETIGDAIQEAWRRNINPGGEVQGICLDEVEAPAAWRNRLLTKKQTKEADHSLAIEITKKRGPQ